MPGDSGGLLGRLAVHYKLINMNQLSEAVAVQSHEPHRKIGEILIERGMITEEQLQKLLKVQKQYLEKTRGQQQARRPKTVDEVKAPPSSPGVAQVSFNSGAGAARGGGGLSPASGASRAQPASAASGVSPARPAPAAPAAPAARTAPAASAVPSQVEDVTSAAFRVAASRPPALSPREEGLSLGGDDDGLELELSDGPPSAAAPAVNTNDGSALAAIDPSMRMLDADAIAGADDGPAPELGSAAPVADARASGLAAAGLVDAPRRDEKVGLAAAQVSAPAAAQPAPAAAAPTAAAPAAMAAPAAAAPAAAAAPVAAPAAQAAPAAVAAPAPQAAPQAVAPATAAPAEVAERPSQSRPPPDPRAIKWLNGVLGQAAQTKASDVHVHAGATIKLRRFTRLVEFTDQPLPPPQAEAVLTAVLDDWQYDRLHEAGEVDLAYSVDGVGRFRANVYRQHRGLNGVFHYIPPTPPTLEELGLPGALAKVTNFHQGLVLVTGPAGCGKSSTLAALVNIINEERTDHVLTIEDPIEYIHPAKRCVVNQRQVMRHTESFARALRAALREDPDVICIGELRDLETISLALSAAETGHLVIGTLHTNSSIRTINRLIGVYPPNQQSQIRTMLSESLRAVISQRLLPTTDEADVVLALEILYGTKAVGNLIRENRTFQLHSVLQTGASQGMCLLDISLHRLIKEGKISKETAIANSDNPRQFR